MNDNYDSANSFGSTGGMSIALKTLVNIGVAFSDWKSNQKTYEQIQGIVIAVKELMKSVTFKYERK